MYTFLYAPILVLIMYSFNNSKLMSKWSGFTFKWYVELFKSTEILNALKVTLSIAILTTIISTTIGTFAAVGLYSMSKKKRNLILNINYIPILNPDIVIAVSLMVLYKSINAFILKYLNISFEFGFWTLLFSHIAFTIPYVVLSVLPKLSQMNKYLYEAATDLGAHPFYAFRKIILKEIMPGVFTGALLSFTLSIDDFVVSFFTTGHGYANLSTKIFSMARKGINPSINALSTILFVVMIVLVLIISIRTKED